MRNAKSIGEVRTVGSRLEAHHNISHSAFRIPHCIALRARPTLANTPVAASATMRDDRPYDMNGSVTPVAGMTARLTPMCTTTLNPTITRMPVARNAPDLFGQLLATGISLMVGLSVVVHMGVSLAVIPATGVTLPFMSYGRSSLIVALAATGVLASVGRARKLT